MALVRGTKFFKSHKLNDFEIAQREALKKEPGKLLLTGEMYII